MYSSSPLGSGSASRKRRNASVTSAAVHGFAAVDRDLADVALVDVVLADGDFVDGDLADCDLADCDAADTDLAGADRTGGFETARFREGDAEDAVAALGFDVRPLVFFAMMPI